MNKRQQLKILVILFQNFKGRLRKFKTSRRSKSKI